MKFKDYYRIIGVAPGASAEDIKSAYRSLARKFHPDVCKEPGAEKRFTEIGEAHETLKDPDRRAAYDRLRAGGWREGQEIDAPQQAREFQQAGGPEDDGSRFRSFFESMHAGAGAFSGRRGGFGHHTFQERGEDSHYRFVVSLDESYHGGERQLVLQTSGSEDPDEPEGAARTISVKIPKGVLQGTHIRLRGQGRPGSSPELNGDLYLDVELAPHPLYQVDGRDLSLEVPLAPWEAVLGTKVEVPTLGGIITATVPAGTVNGQKLRLKGRGLPGDPPGDQYLTLSIAVPASCSDTAKELYRKLAEESAFNPRMKLGV